MFHSLCTWGRRQAARASVCLNRVRLGFLTALALAITVLANGAPLLAQETFPDIVEPFSFTAMSLKIAAFLTVAMAAMAALVVGCLLAKRLLGWVGRGV